ncbi:MAG: site-specific DNA-methyltransferase [Phycisphaerae bacterium]|nr:site-specific DNA-methyltransferase [Phycisphaerae bacterium]
MVERSKPRQRNRAVKRKPLSPGGNGGELPLAAKYAAKERAWARRPQILQNSHRIYLGDSRELRAFPPETQVHLVVTSPPYWNLKEYKHDRGGAQLGHIEDREDFLAELGRVWRNCYRLLVPGGRMCVVVGDVCRARKAFGRHVVEPLHSYIQVQCQEIGFDPLAPMIWAKIANMVTEVSGNGAGFLGKPYEPNAIIKNDIEYILCFRKPGAYRHPTQEQRDLSLIGKEDHAKWFRQIWTDVPGDLQRKHPAPFPVEIAKRLIGMYSFVGDTVFDPFWGIGNTTIGAMEMYRSSIGFEIEPEYVRVGQERIGTPRLGSIVEFFGLAGHQESA